MVKGTLLLAVFAVKISRSAGRSTVGIRRAANAKVMAVSFALALGCSHSNDAQAGAWAIFVESPSPENEQQLMLDVGEEIDNCVWGKPENQKAMPDRFRQDLFGLIAAGNTPGFRVGLRTEKCLDGGDLEDFYRSAGLFFDDKPVRFIEESTRNMVAPERFAKLVTTLPLALADDPVSQLELVNHRIDALEGSGILAITPMFETALMIAEGASGAPV